MALGLSFGFRLSPPKSKTSTAAAGQQMKVWSDGLPFENVGVSSPSTGGFKVWFDGLPLGLST